MMTIGQLYDRVNVVEREVIDCAVAALVWGAFRGGRAGAINLPQLGLLRSMRMSRGTRSSRVGGAAMSLLGTGTFLMLSHTLAPNPHERSSLSEWPNNRTLAYWGSLLAVALVPHTALPAIMAMQAHARHVPAPPLAFRLPGDGGLRQLIN